MRKKFIAGNWKMHGVRETAVQLLTAIKMGAPALSSIELAVFPPFVHLSICPALLKDSPIAFGGQTVASFNEGAYTGEVSAMMLADMGCRYVIVGHSERRSLFHEDNSVIEKKCIQAFSAGLTPILCVGETLQEREQNQTLSVVKEQLAVVSRLKDNCGNFSRIVIAYEPVWAIGTGRVAAPEDAQAVHAFIREQLRLIDAAFAQATRIIYGGSVKPDNAKALFAMSDIDGALVGGASLNAQGFLTIAQCAI